MGAVDCAMLGDLDWIRRLLGKMVLGHTMILPIAVLELVVYLRGFFGNPLHYYIWQLEALRGNNDTMYGTGKGTVV